MKSKIVFCQNYRIRTKNALKSKKRIDGYRGDKFSMSIKRKQNTIFQEKEFFVTLAIFLLMLILVLISFFAVTYTVKLSATKKNVDSLSDYLIAINTRYIEEINTASKQTFFSESLMIKQDEYADNGLNDELYSYIDNQFQLRNSFLIVGVGYIPFIGEQYIPQDVVYSGAKVLFNYIEQSSKRVVDLVISKQQVGENNNGKMYLINYESGGGIHIFARVIRDIRTDTEHFDKVRGIGFIVVNSTVFSQQKNFESVIEGFESYTLFNGESILGETLPSDKLSSSSYYVRRSGFSQHCEFFGVYRKSAIVKELFAEGIIILAVFVTIIVLFTLLYKHAHDRFTRSSIYLIEEFRKIGEKSELATIETTDGDENINHVITTYNNMVGNFIAEKERNERLKEKERQSELQSLYQQINKHFVINVLSAVHSLILLDKKDEANECVEELADFLRYSLSINRSEATLEEEIQSLLSYVKLQRIRYPFVRFDYEIEGTTDDVVLPKFVIQPLVENAYVHGLKNKKGVITMKIIHANDKLSIIVGNSGEDVDADKIEEVNRFIHDDSVDEKTFSTTGNGVALKNIRKRLQLKFASANLTLYTKNGTTFSEISIDLQ